MPLDRRQAVISTSKFHLWTLVLLSAGLAVHVDPSTKGYEDQVLISEEGLTRALWMWRLIFQFYELSIPVLGFPQIPVGLTDRSRCPGVLRFWSVVSDDCGRTMCADYPKRLAKLVVYHDPKPNWRWNPRFRYHAPDTAGRSISQSSWDSGNILPAGKMQDVPLIPWPLWPSLCVKRPNRRTTSEQVTRIEIPMRMMMIQVIRDILLSET